MARAATIAERRKRIAVKIVISVQCCAEECDKRGHFILHNKKPRSFNLGCLTDNSEHLAIQYEITILVLGGMYTSRVMNGRKAGHALHGDRAGRAKCTYTPSRP